MTEEALKEGYEPYDLNEHNRPNLYLRAKYEQEVDETTGALGTEYYVSDGFVLPVREVRR